MMGFTALNVLWLISAFALTRQDPKASVCFTGADMVTLGVTPQITAEHGRPAVLQCNISSELPDPLLVQYMEWARNKTTLCSVDSQGIVTTNTKHASSDFDCEYKNHQLVLTFNKVQPMESGCYGCKLHSNQGAEYQSSRLELEEHGGTVEGYFTSHGPGCTFRHVHPDGDVHWFHGSHHLSHASVKHHTTKRVEEGGWLTIDSSLRRDTSDVPYNCSLKSIKSGRFIASALVHTGQVSPLFHNSGVTATGTVFYMSFLLPFTLN